MADIVTSDIPYERQNDPLSNRMCGPAALCMVYRSFGIDCSQAELAAKVAKPGLSVPVGARTYLLAQDALARGLSAIVFSARDPVRTLRASQNRPVRLILNHRLHFESPLGHFTVPVAVGEKHVEVHDPQVGPNTRMLLSDLVKLWRPLGGGSEITGNVLMALAKDRESTAPCPKCGTAFPDTIACPSCGKPIPLQPAVVLGCMNGSCPERNWKVLFCPYCDVSVVDASGKTLGSAPAVEPAETDDDPLKIKSMSQELDKFVAAILAANNGQPFPQLEKLLVELRRRQKEMLDLQKNQAIERRARAVQPPPAPQPKPAPPPEPVATKPPPRPPVDWNALRVALLKEVGLLGEETLQRKPPASESPGPQLTPRTSEIREFLKKQGVWI